jgi:TonB family protein
MGLSDEVDQERRRENKALKRFVGLSFTGAALVHTVLLSLTPTAWDTQKPRPTEVTIVPRRVSPTEVQVQPSPLPQPSPPLEQSQEPPLQPENPPRDRQIASVQRDLFPAVSTPEGEPDATTDESPLVGSGLAPGAGGFSEGIGLNRSNSPIRGSGGGARRGIPGGSTQRSNPDSDPPLATVSPQPEVMPEDANARRAACRRCPAPDYPRAALQANAEGRVQVAVDVDARGRVVAVRLADSSGDQSIDAVVLETVRERWQFEAISGGAANVPVEVYMTVDGSELNQQAQTWGEQTAVEIPAAGFAAPTSSPVSSKSESSTEPSTELESVEPQLEQESPVESESESLSEALNEVPHESLDELPDELLYKLPDELLGELVLDELSNETASDL